jgi:hypothetical protein
MTGDDETAPEQDIARPAPHQRFSSLGMDDRHRSRMRRIKMELRVPQELRDICREIVAEGKTDDEWSEIEADDWFQTDTVTGGYDALERAFTFSYYAPDGQELWFQLTLEEAARVAAGEMQVVEARPAE